MSQYMMLVYEQEVDPELQAEREQTLPLLLELHDSLREAGCWCPYSVCTRQRVRLQSADAVRRRRSSMVPLR